MSTNSPHKAFNSSPELWQKLKSLAREKRHEPTHAEDRLWQKLRGRQLLNFKFRRQHTIGHFIVDFYCVQAQLVIEVDGEIHQYTQEEDAIRQEFIEAQDLMVLRFTNDDIFKNIDAVLENISEFLQNTQNTDADDMGE
jgi:very-short-patch-repair endonuclease